MKKRKGNLEITVSMYLIVFTVVIVAYLMQMLEFMAVSRYAEDALAMSNLASAVIDLEEYGKNLRIKIPDPNYAYTLYINALQGNMGLDGNMECSTMAAISGEVEIIDYIVYNVNEQDIEITRYGQNPGYEVITGGLGSVSAPNGKEIQKTSVYSCITFPVKGYFGIEIQARKDKMVDITD